MLHWIVPILIGVMISAAVVTAGFRLCHTPECRQMMRRTLSHRLVVPFMKRQRSRDSDWVDDDGPLKMILAVRLDLAMTKGKIAAQCSHATLGAYKQASKTSRSTWEEHGQAKVVVKVKTEQELLDLKKQAVSNGLNAYLVRDAGRTQIAPNSATVLAIGPDTVARVDEVSGHLKLL